MGVEKSVDELLRDEVARVEAMLDPVLTTLDAIKTMAAPAVSAADKIDMLHRLHGVRVVPLQMTEEMRRAWDLAERDNRINQVIGERRRQQNVWDATVVAAAVPA